MKSIIALSDTHGNIQAIEKIMPIIRESDYLFHLGDFFSDVKVFSNEVGEKTHAVLGNCDGGGTDEILTIEDCKILLTHGDKYGVKSGLINLSLKAKELGVNVVFYGHTHLPKIESVDGITFINPGNATRYGQKTYVYAVINKGKILAKIVPLYD